jgi:hypothetical protein
MKFVNTDSWIASIICVDLIIRQFPGKKNFKIEDSNTFLSAGLSLSFGVMVRFATSGFWHTSTDGESRYFRRCTACCLQRKTI